ncbi:hypothetical protein M408DRAFT_68931, partial [Serendipita vermifera MAFF 305830]
IAVEGCCHGELNNTYAELEKLELQTNQKVDALIICGDFQAIRNQSDLLCMAVPQKYRQLGQFHEYYTGSKKAPVLTIVIGGNHEASNYMWELYHGGWLAPNIYYLGGSGCVRLNGIRIAGASGIFKDHDYNLGHYERIPFDNSSLRSVYHVRAHDVLKLSLLSPGPEVFISHDWPEGIYRHGDTAALLRTKPFFKPDIEKGELGNPHMMDVLKLLRPLWWFSAHLHVRFAAEYDHTGQGHLPSTTKFLALDKCVPRRKFLEIIDTPSPQDHSPPKLTYDIEWLAISKAMHPLLSTDRKTNIQPRINMAQRWVEKELEWVKEKIINLKRSAATTNDPTNQDNEELEVETIQQFVMTASGPNTNINPRQQPSWYTNPQTEAFCALIEVENKVNPAPKDQMAAGPLK